MLLRSNIDQDAEPVHSMECSDKDTVMIELEDQLPEIGDDDLDSVQKSDLHWLNVDGRMVHKSSAVQYILYSSEGRKSTDRTSRVARVKAIRCFSRHPDSPSLNDDSLVGNKLLVGQIVCSFTCVSDTVVIAVICVTAILNETGTSVSAIDSSSLSLPHVTLHGQVLTITCDTKSTWTWNGGYDFFPLNKSAKSTPKTTTTTKKTTIIQLPAAIAQTIKQTFRAALSQPGSCANVITTVFETSELNAVTEFLWNHIKDRISEIPSRGATKTFSYRDSEGECCKNI